MTTAMDPETYVASLYRSVLGRDADKDGLAHWAKIVRDTGDPTIVLSNFLASDEYRLKHPGQTPQADAIVEKAKAAFGSEIYAVVDVGAQLLDYEQHIYSPAISSGIKYHVIGFDPLADRLQQRAQSELDQNVTLLPYAIGNGERHELKINNVDATSSLFELDEAFCEDFPHLSSLKIVRREPLETKRLDDVLDVSKIDFLKLDVQGAELMVAQSAKRLLNSTHCVHCEVEFSPIYKDQPLYEDVATYLRDKGFYLVDFIHSCRYPYKNTSDATTPDRLIWADAVFFRDTADPVALASQALTASIIYRKHSLAAHLLAEVEER